MLLALLGSGCSLFAAEVQEVVFAIPEAEGALSIGVFSDTGKLVRSLGTARAVGDFRIGLNGLHVPWDGKDDRGKICPAGSYEVRGWFIPVDVTVTGEAFHFNDWLPLEGPPEIASVTAIVPSAAERCLVVGVDAVGLPGLWSVGVDDVLARRVSLPSGVRFLAGDAHRIVLSSGEGIRILSTTDSATDGLLLTGLRANAAAVSGNSLLLLRESGDLLETLDLTASNPQANEGVEPPTGIRLVAMGRGPVLVSDGSKVWHRAEREFVEIPLGDSPTVVSLSAGPDATFWISGQTDAQTAFVRQYDLAGDLLRQLTLGAEVKSCHLSADPDRLRIFLLEELGAVQRVRGLEPMAQVDGETMEEGVAAWEVILDRSISKLGTPGFLEGMPSPDLTRTAKVISVEVPIASGTLEKKPQPAAITTLLRDGKLWLSGSDGLPLLEVTEVVGQPDVALAVGDNPGSLRLLVPIGAALAEFKVSGLGSLVRLDAGEIVLVR